VRGIDLERLVEELDRTGAQLSLPGEVGGREQALAQRAGQPDGGVGVARMTREVLREERFGVEPGGPRLRGLPLLAQSGAVANGAEGAFELGAGGRRPGRPRTLRGKGGGPSQGGERGEDEGLEGSEAQHRAPARRGRVS
jgi:hypothetical protein